MESLETEQQSASLVDTEQCNNFSEFPLIPSSTSIMTSIKFSFNLN